MNKTELISAVAAATELSRKDADKAVNAAVQVLAAGGVTGENAEAVAATGVDVLVTTWAYFGKPADIKMVVSA